MCEYDSQWLTFSHPAFIITLPRPRREQGKAVPEYEATVAATHALKEQVELSISALCQGRAVHIIGDINTL